MIGEEGEGAGRSAGGCCAGVFFGIDTLFTFIILDAHIIIFASGGEICNQEPLQLGSSFLCTFKNTMLDFQERF